MSAGRSDFVVSVSLAKGLYNCHRCNKGGKIANLGPAFTFSGASPAREAKAAVIKRKFYDWLAAQMRELGDRERRMARKAVFASQALQLGVGWPTDALAWLALADWHHSQRQFDEFWQNATDKCGRLQLYRQWRRGSRG